MAGAWNKRDSLIKVPKTIHSLRSLSLKLQTSAKKHTAKASCICPRALLLYAFLECLPKNWPDARMADINLGQRWPLLPKSFDLASG